MFVERGYNRSILVIEDEEGIREGLVEFLTIEGYTTFSAQNGREGLELLQAYPSIDLILLDYMMPVMHGGEFRRAQLMERLWSKIPVIVLSADFRIEEVVNSLQAQHYLKKPFHLDELMSLVNRILSASDTLS